MVLGSKNTHNRTHCLGQEILPIIAGWWCLEHEWIMIFPSYWEWKSIPTDKLTPSFFRGVGGSTTNQIIICIINHH